MDDVHLADHVVVHEVGQGVLVGDDATDFRRRQEDIFGLLLSEELLHGILSGEVEFFMGSGDDVIVALALKLAHNGRAYHATVPGDIYFTVFVHFYGITS